MPDFITAPLLVGVTGHRDLRPDDLDPLRAAIRGVFEDLRARYPSTPLMLLSALAEGADRLAAEVALEMKIQLVAILPMPPRMYEVDFAAPESIAEFRAQLAAAQLTFVEPLLASETAVSQPGDERNAQYEAAGISIVRQCQILLALWDGVDNGKRGGTGEIVKYQLKGLPDDSSRFEQPEIFPVYHIPTPRRRNPTPAFPAFQLRKLYYNPVAESYYHRIFSNLDEYNREALQGGAALAREAETGRGYVIDAKREEQLPPIERLTLTRYGIADALARRYQRSTVRSQQALHLLIFLAFSCFVCFAHLPEEWREGGLRLDFLIAAMALLTAALLVHRNGEARRVDSKYLDYRAVAEGLRVRFFWQIAGIRDAVASLYLGKQRTELDWIRNGFHGWDLDDRAPGSLKDEAVRLVRANWAEDQFKYFEKKAEQNERSAERFERLVQVFMSLAVAGLAASFFTYKDAFWSDINNIVIDVSLAAGALLHHYANQMAFSEHHKQYKRMANIFESASRALEASETEKEAVSCLLKLGREALAENGDWVLLHRERPLELPHA